MGASQGTDIAPPQESSGAAFVDKETSSGSKSAQRLDYSYCERFFSDSFIWLDSFGCGFHNKTSTAIVPPGSCGSVCGGVVLWESWGSRSPEPQFLGTPVRLE